MQTIQIVQKSGADGSLSLRIPVGQPETEFEVVVVVQAKTKSLDDQNRGWPPGYAALAGSIDDETFFRHPQGELPAPVEFD